MDRPITVAIAGAGGRGTMFSDLIAGLPDEARVAAVAEPRTEYRDAVARRHNLPRENVFDDWREMAARPRLADAVIIATMDRDHVEPAVAFTKLGYDMLLEKPMATSLKDCRRIAAAQEKAGTVTCVCHSLRYNRSFSELKRIVQSGAIGRIITVDQLEQVVWWHQAHSFVRGNWGNEGRSSFMLLAKSCHDVDFIAHLVGGGCRRVQSFGALTYFTRKNAPAGSGERCTACPVEPSCAYSALKLYVDAAREEWPASVIAKDHGREAHLAAVTKGPYGRCVWKCDNDVVDHQVVSMEFDGEVTATFTMTAFAQSGGRKIRVHGTLGEVEFTEERMWVRTFADNAVQETVFGQEEGEHGGGDMRVLKSFLAAVGEKNPRLVLTDVQESLRTHSIVFAAERSRRAGKLVEVGRMR
jgi:predicted dehydrogenase